MENWLVPLLFSPISYSVSAPLVATVGADFGIAPPRRVLDELGAAGLHATLAKDAEVTGLGKKRSQILTRDP